IVLGEIRHMLIVPIGYLHYFVFGGSSPGIFFQNRVGNLVVLQITDLIVEGRIHLCKFKTGIEIGRVPQKTPVIFGLLFVRKIQRRLRKCKFTINNSLANAIQFLSGIIQFVLRYFGLDKDMPYIPLLPPYFLAINDMVTKRGLERFGYFPLL